MRKNKCVLLAVLMGLAAVSCQNGEESAKEYVLQADGLLSAPASVYVGSDTTNLTGYYYFQNIGIGEFILSHSFGAWGFGEGITYTNLSDANTPGYTNMSAITGKGYRSNAYFFANGNGYDTPAQVSFKDNKMFNAIECYVTNSTYSYLAIRDGNDGIGAVKTDWTQNDRFKLTVTGYDGNKVTGTVTFLLADGKDIVSTWQHLDLRPLGRVGAIRFTLSSTDNGDWGMNTPGYFCFDCLKVSE